MRQGLLPYILSALFALPALPAIAQSSSNPAIISGDKATVEHAFGDWGGLRSTLSAQGLDVSLQYTSETASVVSGGVRRGTDYAHSIDLKFDADMQTLLGLNGLTLHGALVERAGRNASADFLHEYLTQVQEIYGGGGDVAAHLANLYGEQKLLDGLLDVEAGRLDVGEDFAASPLYCDFMSLNLCPSPRALTIATGFTIYPAATWGGRIKLSPSDAVALQFGLYQVQPGFGGRSGFHWSSSGTTGAYLPAELDWTPAFGPDRLVGHYKLGMGYDTSSYPDLSFMTPPKEDHGRANFYALADQMLLRTGGNGLDGVLLLGGYVHGNSSTVINDQAFVGLVATGVIPGRQADSIGFQITHFWVSGPLRTAQIQEVALGLPLSSGLGAGPLPDGIQGEQTAYEIRYDAQLTEGLHLMPDLQYISHPNATAHIADATVLGLRVGLAV